MGRELVETIAVRVTKELYEVLKVEAKRKRCRMSDLVRWILVEAVETIEMDRAEMGRYDMSGMQEER